MGLRGGRRRRNNQPPSRRKRIRPRGRQSNAIPMNPYENMDEDEEDDDLDLLPFEDQEELLDEDFRDGNVYNYSGGK